VVETTMELSSWLRKQLEQASPDLLRAMVQHFAEALMGAEADALCGAGYGERSPERVNIRNVWGAQSRFRLQIDDSDVLSGAHIEFCAPPG
jgi:transposase-like protein